MSRSKIQKKTSRWVVERSTNLYLDYFNLSMMMIANLIYRILHQISGEIMLDDLPVLFIQNLFLFHYERGNHEL